MHCGMSMSTGRKLISFSAKDGESLHMRKRRRIGAVEDDSRYKRVDMSEIHAYEARQQFAAEVQKGESGINLAAAALAVSTEDDALVSHSTVKLPAHTFIKRIQSISADLERLLAKLPADASPQDVLQVVEGHLFGGRQFRVPKYGRSNVPSNSILEHPGVWENCSHGYLHEVLIKKEGIAATLAIIYTQVMQNLIACGAIDFAVRVDCSQLDRLPKAQVLHGLTRRSLLRPDGSILNTCSTSALIEMLAFLKRSFWPFPWDTGASESEEGCLGGSGFQGAAEVALEGEMTASLQAISRTAKHRLDRGIWTSSGAGDMRRARAAAERLCILAGDERPWERRDAAILLFHCGEARQAALEMEAYASCSAYRHHGSAAEKRLVDRLQAAMQAHPDYKEKGGELITASSTLAAPPPLESRVLPLTW